MCAVCRGMRDGPEWKERVWTDDIQPPRLSDTDEQGPGGIYWKFDAKIRQLEVLRPLWLLKGMSQHETDHQHVRSTPRRIASIWMSCMSATSARTRPCRANWSMRLYVASSAIMTGAYNMHYSAQKQQQNMFYGAVMPQVQELRSSLKILRREYFVTKTKVWQGTTMPVSRLAVS